MVTTGTTPTPSGVTLDELIEALSRLTTNGQRPPSAAEARTIAHFTDLRAFLGRDNANVPFEFVDETEGGEVFFAGTRDRSALTRSPASRPTGNATVPTADKTKK